MGFAVHELVPEELYNRFGDGAMRFVSPLLVETINVIKRRFPKGTITINNYKWGGSRNWSGVRTANSPYYSPTSLHTFGMAADMVFNSYNTDEVREYIIDNPDEFPHVKGIEIAEWLHIDVRNADKLAVFSK